MFIYPDLPVLRRASVALASGSPRRKELLGRLLAPGSFQIIAADLDESRLVGESPPDYVARLAVQKAEEGARKWYGLAQNQSPVEVLIIAADTTVVLGEAVYGKPQDQAEAAQMLRELSGRTHLVLTGFAARHLNSERQLLRQEYAICSTEVDIKPLTAAEIDWYVATGEPMDKAAAYGAQGFGGTLISAFRGDFYNVIGLPLAPLIDLLRKFT